MRIAHVVGQVVSTAKEPGLSSFTLLIVRQWGEADDTLEWATNDVVAVDLVGAGMGEVVLLSSGGAARIPGSTQQVPTDLAVVGIVDSISHHGTVTYAKS